MLQGMFKMTVLIYFLNNFDTLNLKNIYIVIFIIFETGFKIMIS